MSAVLRLIKQSCVCSSHTCTLHGSQERPCDLEPLQHSFHLLPLLLGKCLVHPHAPEYLDFLGSLLTTAMVNCAKWLQPAGCGSVAAVTQTCLCACVCAACVCRPASMSVCPRAHTNAREPASAHPSLLTRQQLVVVCHAQEQGQVVAHVAALGVDEDVPAGVCRQGRTRAASVAGAADACVMLVPEVTWASLHACMRARGAREEVRGKDSHHL